MTSRPPLTPFGSALAGALGAVFSNAAVYPLDTVKTRLQALPAGALEPPVTSVQGTAPTAATATKQRPSNTLVKLHRALVRRLRKWQMLSMLIRILRTEGLSGAFKGFSANMINTFSQQFAYFFFHSLLRSTYIARQTRLSGTTSLSTPAELSLGAAAGGLAQIFTIPAAVIATRQQLWVPGSSPSTKREPGFFETANEIIAEGGVTALWTGLRPGLVLTVNPAITYGVFERLKSWRLEGDRVGGKLGVGEAFWIGVLSKTLATVVTYPYIFAKVRLQARPTPAPIADQTDGHDEASYAAVASTEPGAPSVVVAAGEGNEEKPTPQPARPAHKHIQQDKGAVALLARVYKEKGLAGWYQGLGAQITKAVLCQGILFVSKDQFEGYAWLILDLIARLRAQVA